MARRKRRRQPVGPARHKTAVANLARAARLPHRKLLELDPINPDAVVSATLPGGQAITRTRGQLSARPGAATIPQELTGVPGLDLQALRRQDDWKKFMAAPGDTGIEKFAAMNAPPAPAAPLPPLQQTQQKGIEQAFKATYGDPEQQGKLAEYLEKTYSPESLRSIPGYTAYKASSAAGIQLESDQDRKLRHTGELMQHVADVKKLIAAGDNRGAKLKLDSLDLDTFNPRVRGQVEEIIKSPLLTPTQKLKEVERYIRFGASGERTPAEEQAEAEQKLRVAEGKEREKAEAKEREDTFKRQEKVADRRMDKADKAVLAAQKALEKAEGDLEDAEQSLKDVVKREGEVDPKDEAGKATAEAKTTRFTKKRDAATDAVTDAGKKLTAATTAQTSAEAAWERTVNRIEDIPEGPGAEGAPLDFEAIKQQVSAAIASGGDAMKILENIPADSLTPEQRQEILNLIVGKK